MFKFAFSVIAAATLWVWLVPGDTVRSSGPVVGINTDGLSPEAATFARSAVDVLAEACPGLTRYSGDIKLGGPARIGVPLWGDRERRGWEDAVIFDFVVSDQPVVIPASFAAGGHRCLFSVNPDGAQGGVSVAKAQCASLCAGSSRSEEQAFFPGSRQLKSN